MGKKNGTLSLLLFLSTHGGDTRCLFVAVKNGVTSDVPFGFWFLVGDFRFQNSGFRIQKSDQATISGIDGYMWTHELCYVSVHTIFLVIVFFFFFCFSLYPPDLFFTDMAI